MEKSEKCSKKKEVQVIEVVFGTNYSELNKKHDTTISFSTTATPIPIQIHHAGESICMNALTALWLADAIFKGLHMSGLMQRLNE